MFEISYFSERETPLLGSELWEPFVEIFEEPTGLMDDEGISQEQIDEVLESLGSNNDVDKIIVPKNELGTIEETEEEIEKEKQEKALLILTILLYLNIFGICIATLVWIHNC